MNDTNIFVKKLLKKTHKIVSIDEIKNLYFDIDETANNKKLYKKIYYLKNQWYLLSLKKDLFFIKKPEEEIQEDEIIQNNYWKYLQKVLKNNFWNNYFIWWFKALQLWNNDFSIPDKIYIINPFKRNKEILFKWKEIIYLKYTIKNFSDEKAFKFFKKFTEKYHIDWKVFNIANYELSLLESLYSMPLEEERFIIEYVKKNIRKNWKKIDLETFEEFLKVGKYGSSIKKLYELSLWIRPDFAEKIKEILKKWYWW